MLGSLFYRFLRTETAAKKLALRGDQQTLIISDTGGSKVKKRSRRVKLEVTNIETNLTAPEADAYVLDNITSDTPALQWSELKKIWPHLSSIPKQRVARRQQVNVLIGSDHSIFQCVLQEVCVSKPDDPIANLGCVSSFGATMVAWFSSQKQVSLYSYVPYQSCQQLKEMVWPCKTDQAGERGALTLWDRNPMEMLRIKFWR